MVTKTETTLNSVMNKPLHFDNKTLVMGILNVTPDSFSDGGQFNHTDKAIAHALEMINDGADIIDIGGESTRPGHLPVPVEVEINRVIPIIRAVRSVTDIPISIDTYKAETARQAIEAGATIINDVWGAKADPNIAKVAAEYHVPIILMHNRNNMVYNNLIDDMLNDLKDSIQIAHQAGVDDEQIIIDPGIGFAKNFQQNLEVMNNLEAFKQFGYPILLGTSRKRFIGEVLNASVDERVEGTGATVCLGIAKGCQIVRVHDVKPISKMARMMDAMIKR